MKYNELPRVTSLGLNKLLPPPPFTPPTKVVGKRDPNGGWGGGLLVQAYSISYRDRMLFETGWKKRPKWGGGGGGLISAGIQH